ncbi:hypothetical protein C8R43DRAFT_1163366 [Mycena crocata]|nr:hypothetical protein C8R43DRAFT_1163366 [Mycena crocata]
MAVKSKNVHWSSTVDEYPGRISPESYSRSLPNQHPTPYMIQHAPLPVLAAVELHSTLSPAHALPLDFSLPSAVFHHHPALTETLLSAPACIPPPNVVYIHIKAGVFKEELEVKHTPSGQTVTVGDVLSTVHHRLRTFYPYPIPSAAVDYTRRRITTANGHCARQDTESSHPRLVDGLCGSTIFAGLEVRLGQPVNYWEMKIEKPRRY